MKRPKAKAFVPVIRGENRLTVMNKGGDYEMNLIGAIGESFYDGTGITHKEFKNALGEIPHGSKIRLNINSEGGSVKDGLGIYSEIEERSEDITAKVTGYALSIASIFPLAAGKVISPKSSIWMMHNAWCMNQGDSDAMRACADMLETHDETLVDIYCEHTGKSKTEIREAMEKETWLKGSEAVEFGLADESEEEEEDEENPYAYKPLSEKYLTRCKNISPVILNCLRSGATPSAEHDGGQQPTPPKEDTMNKKPIVALLKKHGIEASETETEEQLNAKLEQIPVGTITHKTTATVSTGAQNSTVIDLAAVNAELSALKRQRIQDKVEKYVGLQKITNAEVSIFVEAAIRDEAGTFTILDAKESTQTGGEPIGFNRIEPGTAATVKGYQGRPTDMIANMYKECTTPAAKWEGFKSEFPRLFQDGRARDKRMGAVYNENTFAAGITTNFLIMGAITKLGPHIAPLKALSRDNTVDPYKPLASGVQKFNSTVQDGSDTQTNATDFTIQSDSTINPAITISVAQYTQGLHLTNGQLNSGIRMADLIEAKLGSLRSKIMQVVTTPITAANFGGQTPLVQSSIAFNFSDSATLLGQLQKSPVKNLILAGPYIARLSNTPGFFQTAGTLGGLDNAWKAFGWDIIALNTEWQAADANVQGFACHPQAIGVVAGLPLNPPEGIPGNIIQIGTVEIPQAEIGLSTYLWMDANTRTLRATYDLMLGATAVDTTAGIIIRSS